MKKKIGVTLPGRKAVPPRRTVKEITLCDICSKSVRQGSYGRGGGKCLICGRDICEDHTVREYDGDYARKYCIICHPLYLPAIRELEERHDKEEEALERKIKRISLAAPPKVSNVGDK